MSVPLVVTARLGAPCVGLVERPVMLDGPLSWAAWQAAASHGEALPLLTDREAGDFDLPLDTWQVDGWWGWCSSAGTLDVTAWSGAEIRRKPATAQMARYTQAGRHHLGLGPHKARDTTVAFAWVETAVWHVTATDPARLEELLALVTHLGKHHARGFGQVASWTVEPGADPQAWAARPMPDPAGTRQGVRAPYWHPSRQALCSGGAP